MGPQLEKKMKKMSYNKLQLKVSVWPEVVRFTKTRKEIVTWGASSSSSGKPFTLYYDEWKRLFDIKTSPSSDLNYNPNGKYMFDKYDYVYVSAPQDQEIFGPSGL